MVRRRLSKRSFVPFSLLALSIHFFTLPHALPWRWCVSVVESQQCRSAAMASAPSVHLHTPSGLRLEISVLGHVNDRFFEHSEQSQVSNLKPKAQSSPGQSRDNMNQRAQQPTRRETAQRESGGGGTVLGTTGRVVHSVAKEEVDQGAQLSSPPG